MKNLLELEIIVVYITKKLIFLKNISTIISNGVFKDLYSYEENMLQLEI